MGCPLDCVGCQCLSSPPCDHCVEHFCSFHDSFDCTCTLESERVTPEKVEQGQKIISTIQSRKEKLSRLKKVMEGTHGRAICVTDDVSGVTSIPLDPKLEDVIFKILLTDLKEQIEDLEQELREL